MGTGNKFSIFGGTGEQVIFFFRETREKVPPGWASKLGTVLNKLLSESIAVFQRVKVLKY